MSSSDTRKPKFSVAITTSGYQKLINNTLGDPDRARKFISSITSAVAVNPALQECEASSILAGALLGESMNLQPSPQLGQYYLVPFKIKEKHDRSGNIIAPACTKAQFVLGYKGYIQLALRTGQYKKLNVIEIKEGELRSFDYLNEEIECVMIEDFEARENAETIGYYAMFEYMNGFRKAMYWTKDQMMRHADKFSPAFSAEAYMRLQRGEIADKDLWKYSSFWYKNFDDMAKKTMLRQIISKWGIMSADLVAAIEHDNKFMQNQGVNIVEEDIEEPALDQTFDMPQEIIDEAPAEPKNISFDDL